MKILFSMHHLGSFRMYESVVRGLAERGHDLQLVIGRSDGMGWKAAAEALTRDFPNVRCEWLELPSTTFWAEARKTVRLWADYQRYFDPQYANTPRLIQRAGDRLPPMLRSISHLRLFAPAWSRRLFVRILRAAERALPPLDEIDALLERESPDLVLITPLVYLASVQMDLLRGSVARGVRTGFCVGSWDHLSSKALLRDLPLRVFVWNETQRREAMSFHGVPEDRVIVTGAQCYDQWFSRRPSRSREEFCRHVGVPADRPYLLYVGSALFHGSPVEAAFVARWVEALRASPIPEIRAVPVLLRPHPARKHEWDSIDFTQYEGVTVFGSNPIDDASKDDYFDSLHYCAAIVGLNTSAFLEGAIVGRPVHTVLLPEFWENQEGTLHFHYLFNVGGGVLRAGRGYEEHHAQLAESVARVGDDLSKSHFVEAFIRPHGSARSATEIFVAEVERTGTLPLPPAMPASIAARVGRWLLLYPLLRLGRLLFRDRVMRMDWSTQLRERLRVKEIATRERDQRRSEQQELQRAETERRAALRAEKLQQQAQRLQERERIAAARAVAAAERARMERERDEARAREQERKAAAIAVKAAAVVARRAEKDRAMAAKAAAKATALQESRALKAVARQQARALAAAAKTAPVERHETVVTQAAAPGKRPLQLSPQQAERARARAEKAAVLVAKQQARAHVEHMRHEKAAARGAADEARARAALEKNAARAAAELALQQTRERRAEGRRPPRAPAPPVLDAATAAARQQARDAKTRRVAQERQRVHDERLQAAQREKALVRIRKEREKEERMREKRRAAGAGGLRQRAVRLVRRLLAPREIGRT